MSVVHQHTFANESQRPANGPQQGMTPARKALDPSALQGLSVMLIGAPRHSRQQLAELLVELGTRPPELLDDPQQAIQTFSSQPADLVICDHPPHDLWGAHSLYELLGSAHRPSGTILVAICGERDARSVATIAEMGADVYLLKPFERETVRERLLRTCERKVRLRPLTDHLAASNYEQACAQAMALAASHRALAGEAFRHLTTALMREGHFERAFETTRQALTLSEYPWALVRLAELSVQRGLYEEALSTLEDVVQAHPTHVPAYSLLATICEQLGRRETALQWLDQLAEHAHLSPRLLHKTATLAIAVGDLVRAESCLRTLLALERADQREAGDTAQTLIEVLALQGREREASRLIEERNRWVQRRAEQAFAHARDLFDRARAACDRPGLEQAMVHWVDRIAEHADRLPIAAMLRTMESCVACALTESGHRLAGVIRECGRALAGNLTRLEDLERELDEKPAGLLSQDALETALNQLQQQGWDHRFAPAIVASIDYWQRRDEGNRMLRSHQQRLQTLARHFGILRLS
jgi:tetratricopeptide (TPR) repeat protein